MLRLPDLYWRVVYTAFSAADRLSPTFAAWLDDGRNLHKGRSSTRGGEEDAVAVAGE